MAGPECGLRACCLRFVNTVLHFLGLLNLDQPRLRRYKKNVSHEMNVSHETHVSYVELMCMIDYLGC